MSSREPTLADVAELAGTSLTTVSCVPNNRDYLLEKTKKNVVDTIETPGYRPNSLARTLHGKHMQTTDLIVPAMLPPPFGGLTIEVGSAPADAGYRILICNPMGRADHERGYLSLLVGDRVDRVISDTHNEDLSEYDTIHMPLVTIGREPSPSTPSVCYASKEAGTMATCTLIEGGCRRPLLLTSRSGPRNLREVGYRVEIERTSLTPRMVTVPSDMPTPQYSAMVHDVLDEARAAAPAGGVFATDDPAVVEVLEWARMRDLSVPTDLPVTGLDGTETMCRALPHLMMTRQPIEKVTRAVVPILLDQIEGKALRSSPDETGAPHAQTVEFSGTLIQGRSINA